MVSVDAWRRVFEMVYRSEPADGVVDRRGWIDPTTSEPFAAVALDDWLAASTRRILELSPRKIAEIGCGTGNLALALVRSVDRYIGVDVSRAAVDQLDERLERVRGGCSVDADVADALVLEEMDAGTVDTVVINSVSQYFPDESYASRVIGAACRVVAPRAGCVFFGDVRHRGFEAASGVTQGDEMNYEPSFFDDIASEHGYVAVAMPKDGAVISWLTRSRCDIVLAPAPAPDVESEVNGRWLDAIPNPRLQGAEPSDAGIDPGAWRRVGEALGARVELLCDAADPARYHAFVHTHEGTGFDATGELRRRVIRERGGA